MSTHEQANLKPNPIPSGIWGNMPKLDAFLTKHKVQPIVPHEHLGLLRAVVRRIVIDAVEISNSRLEPRQQGKEHDAHKNRLRSLRKALHALTSYDRKRLSDGMLIERVNDGTFGVQLAASGIIEMGSRGTLETEEEGADLPAQDPLTAEADLLFKRLELALDWIDDPKVAEPGVRFDAKQRKAFVEAAASLYVAYGYQTLGGNAGDHFQNFVDSILRDCGMPKKKRDWPAPFNVTEYAIDFLGKTVGDREAWVRERLGNFGHPPN